jgi:hypothetical protein
MRMKMNIFRFFFACELRFITKQLDIHINCKINYKHKRKQKITFLKLIKYKIEGDDFER